MKKLSVEKWKIVNDVLKVDSLIEPLTSFYLGEELTSPTIDPTVRKEAQRKLNSALKGSISDEQMHELNKQGITRQELIETGKFADYGRPRSFLEFAPVELHMELFNEMQESLQKPTVKRGR